MVWDVILGRKEKAAAESVAPPAPVTPVAPIVISPPPVPAVTQTPTPSPTSTDPLTA